MFICICEDYAGVGKTLKEAHTEVQIIHRECKPEECEFYEATQIQVEVRFEKKKS